MLLAQLETTLRTAKVNISEFSFDAEEAIDVSVKAFSPYPVFLKPYVPAAAKPSDSEESESKTEATSSAASASVPPAPSPSVSKDAPELPTAVTSVVEDAAIDEELFTTVRELKESNEQEKTETKLQVAEVAVEKKEEKVTDELTTLDAQLKELKEEDSEGESDDDADAAHSSDEEKDEAVADGADDAADEALEADAPTSDLAPALAIADDLTKLAAEETAPIAPASAPAAASDVATPAVKEADKPATPDANPEKLAAVITDVKTNNDDEESFSDSAEDTSPVPLVDENVEKPSDFNDYFAFNRPKLFLNAAVFVDEADRTYAQKHWMS